LNNLKLNATFKNINFKGKKKLLNTQNRINGILKVIQGNYDIYHQTHYEPYAYKYLPKKKKAVTTIHDMNFFVIPEAYKEYPFPWIADWQKISAFKANKIITPSENSKNDIINIWKIPNEKIEVVYYGIDPIDLENFDLIRKIDQPYILFVGNRDNYKNFLNFLKSFKIILNIYKDLLLICTGNPFNNNEKKKLSEMELLNKILQISADENTMINLYKNAELFVYPSLYEGFGLPLIEAMNCQCPVICSKTSCFPEVAGNAAMYFNPYSIEEMAETVVNVLNDSRLKQNLIKSGIERVKKYSWEECANKYIKIYKSLCNL
jgi:glycosyltransferase involved in cell wall biosynthesis